MLSLAILGQTELALPYLQDFVPLNAAAYRLQ
jgi:hypothetical protein